MANTLFETGRAGILAGTFNWATGFGASGTIQAALMQTSTFTTGIKQISGCTAATPPVVTATAHGFANGDLVIISGLGGTLNANGIFQISGVATNTFQLTDPVTGLNVVGTGTYTSGGVAVNLGPSFGTWASYSANLVGTVTALTGETETGLGSGGSGAGAWTETDGTANANSVTFTGVSGANPITAVALIATASSTSGTIASTDKMVAWIDGQLIVTCAAAISAATTLPVERLAAGIPNSTVLSFSDGNSATINGAPLQYARTITVTSSTVTAGARATAPASGSGLPVTPNGGNISITWDPNAYKIFKL